MMIESQSADPRIHEAAIRIGRGCRFTTQAGLREKEWADACREFYVIACDGLERFQTCSDPQGATANGRQETTS
jgi:hypothetical protein